LQTSQEVASNPDTERVAAGESGADDTAIAYPAGNRQRSRFSGEFGAMEFKSCAKCGMEIEGKGITFRGNVFCTDECCEEFEAEFAVKGGPDEDDLDEDDFDEDFDEDDFDEDDDEDDLGYRDDDDFDKDDEYGLRAGGF
jgi:hypothetical protein